VRKIDDNLPGENYVRFTRENATPATSPSPVAFSGGTISSRMSAALLIGRNRVIRISGLITLWTFFGLLGYTRHYLQVAGTPLQVAFWPELPLWLCCYWAWIPLTPAVFWFETLSGQYASLWRRVLFLIPPSVVFSYAAYLLSLVLGGAVKFLENEPPAIPRAFWVMPLVELCMEQSLFWAIVVTAFLIRQSKRLQARDREAAALEVTLRQAELETLRARLNPHFLFNSLQNISALTAEEPHTASRMISKLGDLLRVSFRREFQSEVTLETEVMLGRTYLEIEKMRFGDRLQFKIDMTPETHNALVPSLLLQPLLENAIVHGLARMEGLGEVFLTAETRDGRLILTVRDNGSGFARSLGNGTGAGVGLGSTCERLRRLYPGQHEISLVEPAGGGTEVRIAIPFRVQLASERKKTA
jgi:signal transduction histidine kinase